MSDRFFSLVLQKEPRHVDDAAVVERLRDLVAPIGLSVSLLKDGLDGGPAVLEIGGAKVSIVRQAQPVPDGTLERVARGSIGWPEAPAAVAVHTGHVIVGCLEEAQDHQQALHFAAMTTLATAAVLQESDGLGVYWSTGEIMVSGQGWQQAAGRDPGEVPAGGGLDQPHLAARRRGRDRRRHRRRSGVLRHGDRIRAVTAPTGGDRRQALQRCPLSADERRGAEGW